MGLITGLDVMEMKPTYMTWSFTNHYVAGTDIQETGNLSHVIQFNERDTSF
jgi:hypothetical protein